MKKKITLVLIMLIFTMIAVGSVSAAENVTDDVATETIDEQIIDEAITDDASTDDANEINKEITTRSSNDQTVYSNMSSDENFDNIMNGTIDDRGNLNQQITDDNILTSNELLGACIQEIYSNSEAIIKNPDFSDDLTGWEYNDVSTSENGYEGSCIILNKLGSYISQNIDWSLIEKIGLFCKFDSNAMTSALNIKIGETSFEDTLFYDKWQFVEINTSSIEGFANLTLTSSYNMADFATGPIYIDSIMYLLKSSPVETKDLIINPDFTNELNGWNYGGGAVFPLRNGENSSGISLIQSDKTSSHPKVSLYQNINWSSIEKITFKYKFNSNGVDFYAYIGDTQILYNRSFNPSEWIMFEYDTSSFEGFKNLTFTNAGSTGTEVVIDSIKYELKPLINTTVSVTSDSFGSVVITLTNASGSPIANTNITYKVNGVETTNSTDADGKIKLSDLIGLVTVDANFTGNEVYNGNFTSASFDFKLNSNITITNESKVIIITLVDENGKAIVGASVKYVINNGEELSNNTDVNGQFKISEVPDEFEIKVNYIGNNTFNANNTSAKFNFTKPAVIPPADNKTNSSSGSQTSANTNPTGTTTKKVASKITAKKATFKAKKKTKKYTITLKAGKKPIKKVKVTIKVGKKTYTAKTNAKGKATFNLKKLTKKGKYTAVIKFKGNKNYKATSKKVKITVKK